MIVTRIFRYEICLYFLIIRMNPSQPKTKGITKSMSNPEKKKPKFGYYSGNYHVLKKLGKGSFSCVYKAKKLGSLNNTQDQEDDFVALKTYYSNRKHQQAINQIKTLQKLHKNPRFPEILDIYMTQAHTSIVYKLLKNHNYQKFKQEASLKDKKHYLLQLLHALNELKKIGYVHCDVKPSNFMYDQREKKGVLIDFGFAIPSEEIQKYPGFRKRRGTVGYIPMEVFLEGAYSPASDIWAVGVIMLELLLRKKYIFHNLPLQSNQIKNYHENLVYFMLELAVMFGTTKMKNYFKQYQLDLPKNVYAKGVNLKIIVNTFVDDKYAVDLVCKLLKLDPETRITVEEAINHPFFNQIRHYYQRQ